MPTLSKQYALIDFDPANPASTFKEPISVDVTLDETRVPYVSATVVMPTNALPFNPDPRQAQYYRLRLQQDFGDLIYVYELTAAYGGSVSAFTAAYSGAQITRTNLITNPSFEVNSTGWGTNQASLAISSANSYVGTKSVIVTCNAASNAGVYFGTTRIPVSAGSTYTGSVYALDINTSVQFSARIEWYNAATGGTRISITTGTATTINSTTWTRLSVTGTAPAGATHAVLDLYSVTAPLAGRQMYVDAGQFEIGSTATEYFDGSLPDGLNLNNEWTGTANASTSTQLTGDLVNCQEITRDYAEPWNIFEPALPLSTVTAAYGGDVSNITAAGLIEIWRMSDFLHSSGTFNPAPSTVFDGVLMLRKATKDYISGETTLELTSKDAILLDSIGYPSDLVFTFTNLRDIINYILADVIGITTQLEPGTANATYSPSYGVKWLPDQTAWDYLNNLVTAANLVLYCDENGKFYLIESAAVAGELELKDDDNITRLTSTIDRNSEQFFDRAVVEYRNTGSLPVYYNFGVSGFPVSKDRYFLIENQTAPGGNPAQAVVNRAVTRGEIYEVEAINNFNARPRQTMTIDVSGEPVKTAIIQTVRFGLPSARMSVDIRDLEEV